MEIKKKNIKNKIKPKQKQKDRKNFIFLFGSVELTEVEFLKK